MKMTETKLTAVQTSQGTWVRRAEGADDPMRHVNVAQVYSPPSDEVDGSSLAERLHQSEATMLETAKMLASAPELAAMLRRLCEAHWMESNPSSYSRRAVREAEALLAKVGG